MKVKIRNHVGKAERENNYQIKRYFDQEKEYINSGHKDFEINFERKQDDEEDSKSDDSKSDGQTLDEEKFTLARNDSSSTQLNILDFKNDSEGRKKFYQSSKILIGELWEDDAIILEAILKHLQIIQDSLSDKLKKIIHYEIFHSTKIFVEQDLANALIDEWKQDKGVMNSDESQRQKIEKLENDIKKNKQALDIVSGMTRMIRNFQIQDKIRNHQDPEISSEISDASDEDIDTYDEDMDERHLDLTSDAPRIAYGISDDDESDEDKSFFSS